MQRHHFTVRRSTFALAAAGLIVFAVALALFGNVDIAQTQTPANPAPVQTFYVPIDEDDALTSLQNVGGTSQSTSPVFTYISIAIGSNGTVVYYDQWENGFQNDVANSDIYSASNLDGTQIWGNGEADDGCRPAITCTDAADVLNAGDVIVLNNDNNDADTLPNGIPVPRVLANLFFDGGDKIAATQQVAVSRAYWPSTADTLNAGAVEVYPVGDWGTYYVAPVGENNDLSDMFEYTALSIQASVDGTVVTVDANGPSVGGGITQCNLNQGQSCYVDSTYQGATVSANFPVQVNMMTGDPDFNLYEYSAYTLLPYDKWANSVWSPVSGDFTGGQLGGDDRRTQVAVFNPSTSPIYVRCDFRDTANDSTQTIPAGGVGTWRVPARSGVHCFTVTAAGGSTYNPNGARFFAISTVDAENIANNDGSGTANDWGLTLLPESFLDSQALVGLGLGRDPTSTVRPDQNGSPVWVTSACSVDTYLYVDRTGDGNPDAVDLNGDNDVDDTVDTIAESGTANGILLTPLKSVRIFDHVDRNQTGMQLWTRTGLNNTGDPGCNIAVAWGQDPEVASGGPPGFDVGTTVPPIAGLAAAKQVTDVDGDGYVEIGDELLYTIVIKNTSRFATLVNVGVEDTLPAGVTYVANSTYKMTGGAPEQIPDNTTGTPFPLDNGGVDVGGTMSPLAQWTVSFLVTVNAGIPDACNATLTNEAIVDAWRGIIHLVRDAEVTVPIDCPAKLTIVKVANGLDSAEFDFTTSGGTTLPPEQWPPNFTITAGPWSSAQRVFPLPAGTYGVTELAETSWTLTALACVNTGTTTPVGTVNLGTRTVSVPLPEAGDVTCTFTNVPNDETVTIIIDKTAIPPDPEPGETFTYQIVVTNNSPGAYTAYNVVVTDELPAGLSSVSVPPATYVLQNPSAAQADCTYTGDDSTRLLTCGPVAKLLQGQSIVITWNVIALEGRDRTIVNNACFQGTNIAGRVITGCDTVDITTPVSLASFKTEQQEGSVKFTWGTATETANIGFNLFAVQDGKRVKVNDALILSPVRNSTAVQEYSYTAEVAGGSFVIQDVDAYGRTRSYGPFEAGKEYGAQRRPEPIDWAAINAEAAATLAARDAYAAQDATARAASAAAMDTAGAAGASEEPLQEQYDGPAAANNVFLPLLSGPPNGTGADPAVMPGALLDVLVKRDGVYRLTYEALKAQSIDLAGVPSRWLALTHRGEALPLRVVSRVAFGPGAFVEFYGAGLDTLYTDTNVYTLHLDRNLARRPVLDSAAPAGGAVSTYLETVTVDEEKKYDPLAQGSEPWYARDMLVYKTAADFDQSITLDEAAGGAATLNVTLWGVTDWSRAAPDHHAVVSFDGAQVANLLFDGMALQEVSAPLGGVASGEHTLRIHMPADTGVDYDYMALDKYSVSYQRNLAAREGLLSFEAQGGAFQVKGLRSADVVAYKLDGGALVRLGGAQVAQAGGGYTATFPGDAGKSVRYVVYDAGAAQTPAVRALAVPADITSGQADFVVVAHPAFVGGLDGFVAARTAQGLTVKVVSTDEVYRRFNYGVVDAQAIRDYVAFAHANLGARYVLLVGGDSYDYRNYQGYGSLSFVPTLYAQTDEWVRFAPVDPLLGDVDGDRLPDLAVGRWPVRTQAELAAIVAKTLAHDTRGNRNSALFAADRDGGRLFSNHSESFINRLGSGWSVTKAYLDDVDLAQTRSTVYNALNGGVAVASFAGHSELSSWSFDDILNIYQVRSLRNGDPSVVLQWGCWNTYVSSPYYSTMGHAFMLNPDGGAAAVLGASTVTKAGSEQLLGEKVMERLATPGTRIGDAVTQAKKDLYNTYRGLSDVYLGWTLLGDPTLVVQK